MQVILLMTKLFFVHLFRARYDHCKCITNFQIFGNCPYIFPFPICRFCIFWAQSKCKIIVCTRHSAICELHSSSHAPLILSTFIFSVILIQFFSLVDQWPPEQQGQLFRERKRCFALYDVNNSGHNFPILSHRQTI